MQIEPARALLPDEMLTAAVARQIGVSVLSVHKYRREGLLKPIRFEKYGRAYRYVFRRADVAAFRRPAQLRAEREIGALPLDLVTSALTCAGRSDLAAEVASVLSQTDQANAAHAAGDAVTR